MDYLFWGVCIILFIMMLINQTKKVKSSEAYVIERHKRFYKVVSSKVVFIIPFLDKIKCVVNLDSHIKKCYPAPIILADNTTILVNINIVFKVIDACKVAYSDKSLESHLEYLAITELRSISRKLDSSNVKYIDDKVKEDLKSILNRKGQDLGCKIEDLEIKIGKNTDANNIDNYYEKSVVDYSMYNNNGLYIIILIGLMVYIFGYSCLSSAYASTNNLLFYFFKVLLENLPEFAICIELSVIVLSNSINQKRDISIKKLQRGIIGMAIIFFCIYDIIAEPKRISISENRTSNFSYKCAIISDIISNQTITVDVSNITADKHYSRSTTGIRHRIHYYYPACIKYNSYSSEATDTLVEIVNKLKKYEDTVKIEYYNNSKIIKSIDGIDKFNYDQLNERVEYLIEQKTKKLELERIEEEKIKQEQEQKEKEARELSTKINKTKSDLIGKNIKDVKKELEELGVSDIPIKYISSKYYPIGTVAFVEKDGENFLLNTFYVIESNEKEDLTIPPKLELKNKELTKENIIKIQEQLTESFENCGLKCQIEIDTEKSPNRNKDILPSFLMTPPGEGQYYPKGSVFKFRIVFYE